MSLPAAKIERYLETTRRALDALKIAAPTPSWAARVADDFLSMARNYYADAVAFSEKGDFVNAFACVNYAHGWLDAGARLGVFDVGGDNVLFTLLE